MDGMLPAGPGNWVPFPEKGEKLVVNGTEYDMPEGWASRIGEVGYLDDDGEWVQVDPEELKNVRKDRPKTPPSMTRYMERQQRALNDLGYRARKAKFAKYLERLGYVKAYDADLTTTHDDTRRFTATPGDGGIGDMAAIIGPVGGQVTDRLLTDDQAAVLLKVGLTTIRKLRRSNDLETVYIGSAARVRLSDVERIIREGIQ